MEYDSKQNIVFVAAGELFGMPMGFWAGWRSIEEWKNIWDKCSISKLEDMGRIYLVDWGLIDDAWIKIVFDGGWAY